MKKNEQMYYNIIIKNIMSFYIFIFIGISLIFILMFLVDINITAQYKADYMDNEIIKIDQTIITISDIAYIYSDKDENVYKVKIEKIEYINNHTYIRLDNNIGFNIHSEMNIELIIGKQNLFERIFHIK